MARKFGIGLLACAVLSLSACGGGGGGGIASTPAPTPAPTPQPPPATSTVQIFDSPTTQQFAAYNAGPSDLRIRYDDSSGLYEVSSGTGEWQALRQGATHYEFGPQNPAHWLSTYPTPTDYQYTALADWSTVTFGKTAFGIATPEGAVPTTGSATFDGRIMGWSDAITVDSGYEDYIGMSGVGGDIALAFDFSAGTLSGSIHPQLFLIDDWSGITVVQQDLGTYNFTNTVYSSGATHFSGIFDTSAAGANSFNGQFTGPGAEEVIGRWALPFVWVSDPLGNIPGDGQVHSAWGVFIGKR